MAEWLYREAGQIKVPDAQLSQKTSIPELREAIDAFAANVDRVREFWRLYPYLMEQASINSAKLCKTIWEMTGRPLLTEEEAQDEALCNAITDKMTAQFDHLYNETGSKEIAAGYDFDRALERFEGLIPTDPDMDKAVYATFSSQLIAMWTTFETLSADLWLTLLKCKPDAVEKPQRHSHQSLRKIQDAFGALSPRSEKIDAVLAETALRRLSLVRNVLLHRAGQIDQEFLDGAARIKWLLADQLGQPIQLDGRRVRELVNPAIGIGVSLIRAVDEWIISERRASS